MTLGTLKISVSENFDGGISMRLVTETTRLMRPIDVYGHLRSSKELENALTVMKVDALMGDFYETFGQTEPIILRGGVLDNETGEVQKLEELVPYLRVDDDVMDESLWADGPAAIKKRWQRFEGEFAEHYEEIFLGKFPKWYLTGFTLTDEFIGLYYKKRGVNTHVIPMPCCALYLETEPESSLEFVLTEPRRAGKSKTTGGENAADRGTGATDGTEGAKSIRQAALYRLYRKRWFEPRLPEGKISLKTTGKYAPVSRDEVEDGVNLTQTWFYEDLGAMRRMMYIYTRGAHMMADVTTIEGL